MSLDLIERSRNDEITVWPPVRLSRMRRFYRQMSSWRFLFSNQNLFFSRKFAKWNFIPDHQRKIMTFIDFIFKIIRWLDVTRQRIDLINGYIFFHYLFTECLRLHVLILFSFSCVIAQEIVYVARCATSPRLFMIEWFIKTWTSHLSLLEIFRFQNQLL